MKYKALRFIDFLRPGDAIPDGVYDAGTLGRLVEKGMAVVVDESPPVEETAPAPPEKRVIKARKGGKAE